MKSTVFKPLMVVVYLGLTQTFFSGCSNDSERIVTQAPQSKDELGYLVSGVSLEERNTFFQNHKNVKIREISNEDIVVFEVIETDFQTLRINFPTARITKNQFMSYGNVQNKLLSLEDIKNLEVDRFSSTSSFDIQSCRNDSLKPISRMTPVTPNLLSRKPIEIGDAIQLSSSQSQPHAFVGGPINKAWIVQGPQGTFIPEVTYAETLDITFDTMGMYQIYLLVQDKKLNCEIDNINVSVTGNTPYIGVRLSNVDPKISNQPYLQKLGVEKAHQDTKGEGVLIAVVDSGVNYNNPYLSENIFINKKEIPDNNIDDDGNGLVDDVHGWDFAYNDKFPYDDLGHGSHVAGLAAGKVFGIAPNAQILPIKVGSNTGMIDLGTIFQGVIYALKMDADIINLSLGGGRDPIREELELYKMALKKDTLIVAAAGNGEPSPAGIFLGVDIDNKQYSPAGINLENILSVASVSYHDSLAYYSNFGFRKINVATYGGEDFDLVSLRPYDGLLYSAYIENAKGELFHASQGTSMAAPVAAGIAALVRSVNSNLSAGQVTRLLESVGPEAQSLKGKVKSGRILTADDAVELAKSTAQRLF